MTLTHPHPAQYRLEAAIDAIRRLRTYSNRRTFTISLVCLAQQLPINWSSGERTYPGVERVIQSTSPLARPFRSISAFKTLQITANFPIILKQHMHFKGFPLRITFSPTLPQNRNMICTLPHMSSLEVPLGPLCVLRRHLELS
jgi:hypothetical protein